MSGVFKISSYFKTRDSINPITGSYEPERPNPLDQMSDEQKEYEAVKLVNMIDQLQRYRWNLKFETVYLAHLHWWTFTEKESYSQLVSVKMVSLVLSNMLWSFKKTETFVWIIIVSFLILEKSHKYKKNHMFGENSVATSSPPCLSPTVS